MTVEGAVRGSKHLRVARCAERSGQRAEDPEQRTSAMTKKIWVRRGLRALTLGCALGVLMTPVSDVAWSAVGGASPPSASVTVAQDGAGWLAAQIMANGGDVASGTPDPTDTAYAVLGLYAAGVGKSAASEAISFLETQLGAIKSNPGALAEFILAAHAAGVNPRQFGGTATTDNLVTRLMATQQTMGLNKGLFGKESPKYDGAFRQGLALAALNAADVPASYPTVVRGIAWLEKQQCSNGLWQAYRADTKTPCPASNAETYTGPDTNSTSLAVQGLAAYGDYPMETSTIEQFHQIQSADGGFAFVAASGQSSDPDSTALVIQALIAEGQDPASASWTVSGSNPYTALASYQLGCSAPAADRGAFYYPGSSDPNVIATVQAVAAAAGDVLPVPNGPISTSEPTLSC